MKIKTKYLSLILLSLFLVSCNNNSSLPIPENKDDAFITLFPKCEMNSSIRFLSMQEPAKLSNTIFLDYQNHSETVMSFPIDLNLKIFRYTSTDTKQWVRIDNDMNYGDPTVSTELTLGPASSGMDSIASTSINPVLHEGLPLTIRVSITTDSHDKCFGAFIDVKVEP